MPFPFALVLLCAALPDFLNVHQPHPAHRLHQSKPGASLHLLPAPSFNVECSSMTFLFFNASSLALNPNLLTKIRPIDRFFLYPEALQFLKTLSVHLTAPSHPSIETTDFCPPLQPQLWHWQYLRKCYHGDPGLQFPT